MEDFEVLIEEKNEYWFQMLFEEITVQIEIMKTESGWFWNFFATISNEYGYAFQLENGEFQTKRWCLDVKKEQKMKECLYELIYQLKRTPRYRLKLITLLNDEVREIWNKS